MNPTRTFAGEEVLNASSARRALAGFALSGYLMALLGAILPVWGYHLSFDFSTVGDYFLHLAVGLVLGQLAAPPLIRRRSLAFGLVAACVVACLAYLGLAFASPSAPPIWRKMGLLSIGASTGLLNHGLFVAIAPAYRQNPAATVNMGGIFFVAGCVLAAFSVGGAFYAYSMTQILLLMAIVPAVYVAIYRNTTFPLAPPPREPALRVSLTDAHNPAAILLALLLFFQFGNEWSIAGWLTVYLIHQIGISPESSLSMLALYWISLLVGRIGAIAVLPRVAHGKLLTGSAALAMFGCIILMSTNNRFGAVTGVLFTGLGFASMYPLVAEKIGHRFAYYRPGLFNGIFSLAQVGATLAPASLGYLAAFYGLGVVMLLPMLGTIMVSVLVGLIWLESKIGR